MSARLVQLKKASMVFDQQILRDGELLLSARVRIAALEAASFRPRGMDEAVLAMLHSTPNPNTEEQRMIATLLALQAVTEALPADVSNAATQTLAQATTGGGINYLELMARPACR